MIKTILTLLLCVAIVSSAIAQELKPRFSVMQADLTAQRMPRLDTNGKNCAVVKVLFVGDVVGAECGVVGDLVRRTNEVWVYMPQNSRQLRIITKDFLPIMVTFADYGIERLESGMTYELALVKPTGTTTTPVTPFASSNSVNISSSPSSSSSSSSLSGNTITIPIRDGVNIEMVRVEAGTFTMGATPEMCITYDYDEDEDGVFCDYLEKDKPAHSVTLTNDYYIGKYEVTQAQWQAVMGSNPSNFKGAKLPVEKVSWNDCQEFICKLNSLTGRHFRLPTEAEWEYAARGGKNSRGCQYSGSNDIGAVAWYDVNSGRKTHPVGMKQANELGIYDMTGNVYEWCQDRYGSYSSLPQTNPTGPSGGAYRVNRGGSWQFDFGSCLILRREVSVPDSGNDDLGFRLCLSE